MAKEFTGIGEITAGTPPSAEQIDQIYDIILNAPESEHEELIQELANEYPDSGGEILSELKDLIQERANESDTGEVSGSEGCASNVYVGQQQEDGSWKTVCKNTEAALEADSVEPVIVETSTDAEILQQLEQLLVQPEVPSSEGCASNVYVGQQQEDGSWKTVCKK